MEQPGKELVPQDWCDDSAGYSSACKHWHPVWVPVQVQVTPLLTQIPASVPGKATEHEPDPWAPTPVWENWKKLLTPSLDELRCGHCDQLESQQMED